MMGYLKQNCSSHSCKCENDHIVRINDTHVDHKHNNQLFAVHVLADEKAEWLFRHKFYFITLNPLTSTFPPIR